MKASSTSPVRDFAARCTLHVAKHSSFLTCFHRMNGCGDRNKRDAEADVEVEAEAEGLFKRDLYFPGRGDTCESYFGECCEVCMPPRGIQWVGPR